MIVWFDDITASDVDLVGGKGANLGECTAAGFPVPNGFCVSAEAYRQATSSISESLIAAAERGDAAAARAQILSLELPPKIRSEISKAYESLAEPPVAVRSSATAEDLATASFAGQQDTYLDVRGPEAVLEAVRSCWASLWTDRAVAYRREQGVSNETIAIAVVIQELVAADTAGVLFTSDPVTGDDSLMLASASYGLGESVVAALVTPDTFTLSRQPAAVTAKELGSKETRIDPSPAGGTLTSEVTAEQRSRQCVSDEQLLELLALGEKVQIHYGCGQDIEWAFVAGELFLLQARPITSSAPVHEGHPPAKGRLAEAVRDDILEHFPAPFPLDLVAVHRVQGAVAGCLTEAGFKSPPVESVIFGDESGVIRVSAVRPRPTLAALFRLPVTLVRGLRHNPGDWPLELELFQERRSELADRAQELSVASSQQLLALVSEAMQLVAEITKARFLNYLIPMVVNRAICNLLLKLSRSSSRVTPEDLYAGVAYKTAEITAAIAGLAAVARDLNLAATITDTPSTALPTALASTLEGRTFQAHVADFLAVHGARTARPYLPFSNRSWREDPDSCYAILASVLKGEPLAQSLAPDLVTDVAGRLPRFLRGFWRATATKLQTQHVGREASVYLIEECYCVARLGVAEAARRLVENRQLVTAADLPYLYFDELAQALAQPTRQLQELVASRKRARGNAEAIWWDRGAKSVAGEAAVSGLPASAGQAVGTARIIRSVEEFPKLQPGDVLVCPYTDPTWTPLFALAAAVVADSGGPLSHAAIVAREYGIPAVLGTGNATSLPDGASVRVDGTSGTVTLL